MQAFGYPAALLNLLSSFMHQRFQEPITVHQLKILVLAFGRVVNPVYNLAAATRILALDVNFLSTLPGSLAYARQFIEHRRTWSTSEATATGDRAPHR